MISFQRPLHFRTLSLALAALAGVGSATAEPYVPPAPNRETVNLDSGWRFLRQDTAGAQNPAFDDSGWISIDLPHTWNNLDGQDGGSDYYRGIGWYRRHYTISTNATQRRFFLKFDGANTVSDVYVNGNFVGEHRGGYAAFTFDVTGALNVGSDNVIAVKVSNASVSDVPPLSADFTFFGGIYRDVHLLTTDPLHVSPLDCGSPGVHWETTNVTAASADLRIVTVVSNSDTVPRAAVVRAMVVDSATNIVIAVTNTIVLAAGSVSNVSGDTVVASPHLWNGRDDPYLYRIFVEVGDGTNVTDVVDQPLGFRSFAVDPTNGFFLNGRAYDLHGVDLHQDWLNRGWAIGEAERRTNFMLIRELGATAVRLAHYEHDEQTYDLADQNGLVLWTEVPLVNGVTASGAFNTNAEQQLIELIRQRRNHPSVICWGVFNEESSPSADTVVSQLVQVVHREDPTRPAAAASNKSISTAINWMPDLTGFNEYFGWYGGTTADIGPFLDNLHATYPARCVGISEYGAGASLWQHSEEPLTAPPPYGTPHPEEWQNKFHEDYWLALKQRPFLWCKFIWNLCDFAVDSRNEGDTPGRNDKGLVTYDRQIRKDAFYWYQANWTTNPMVHITGHTFTNRLTNCITAKVYANCDSVELFVNGTSQGTRTSTNCMFTWPVTLTAGSNSVQAIGTRGGVPVSDSLAWFAPLALAITNPSASVVFLSGTSNTLALDATIVNSPDVLPVRWSQVSGPGTVTFGDPTALDTVARFSADGVYELRVGVTNGTAASATLTVVVNAGSAVQNGLSAWWKMDEIDGAITADSSGNGRDVTVTGAVFTSGYISNALQFNGTTGRGSFVAQDTNQVTAAAWVRADAQGNSQFPRIVETPSFRLMFRFGSSDVNSVGFATLDGVNGDWDSGGGSISLGSWYHVAATYDRSNLTNRPVFYVNGVRRSTVTLAMPSGTAPPFVGTGYIGNRSALDRAWSGLIDDVRLYRRVLTDAEVRALAAMPLANLAPAISAGTNQTLSWPATVQLAGSVSDDGRPSLPGTVAVVWAKLSGAGDVTFGDARAPVTTATLSAPGLYVLQLSASDGEVETRSSVSIALVVPPALSIQAQPGRVQLSWPTDAGTWRMQYQTNALGTGLGDNWQDIPGIATNPFIIPAGPSDAEFYRLVLTNAW